MDRVFDHHFMGPHSIHHPEKPRLFSLHTSVRGEGGKSIGNNPYPPSFAICRATAPVGQGLMGREMFVAPAEGAVFLVRRFSIKVLVPTKSRGLFERSAAMITHSFVVGSCLN